MPISSDNHRNAIIIGSGRIYIDRFDDNGDLTGERYLGDSIDLSLTTATENVQVFSGDGAQARELVNSPRQVTRSGTVTLHDMSLDNWALWAGGGEVSAINQSANPVVAEAHTVRQGRWYALGGGDALRKVSIMALATSPGATVIPAANNWEADLEHGRFYVVPGGAIDDGDTIRVNYTPVARTLQQASGGEPTIIRGAVRYIENNPINGIGRNIYVPNATIAPSGDTALKSRDAEQQIVLALTMLPRASDGVSIIINGEAT